MKRTEGVVLLVATLALLAPATASAQSARPAAPPAPSFPPPRTALRPLAVAKWTTLAAAVGLAVYGYRANRLADSRYTELDRLCQAQPATCLARQPDGAFSDAGLEARYQDVRRLDRRAAVGLIGGEVGAAAALTLFLLDLRHAGGDPPDIPYRPPQLQLRRDREGALELRYRLPVP